MDLPFQKLREYFSRGDGFLSILIASGFIRITSARVDFEKKGVTIKKSVTGHYKDGKPLDAIQTLRGLLKPFGKLNSYNVMVSLGSNIGTTVHSTVPLVRDNPKSPIDASDLDNRIAQGMWKVFDRERGGAAKKMGVEDLEVLLTDVRIKSIRLDGHKVVNPVGFPAATIELQFNQTFLPQHFAIALREVFRDVNFLFIGEGGVMQADMLTRLDFPSTFLFAEIFPHIANIFSIAQNQVTFLETIPWGRDSIVHAVGADFAVEKQVAETLLNIHYIRRASTGVLKKIEKSTLQEFKSFMERCNSFRSKEYAPKIVFLSGSSSIPELVFQSPFRVSGGSLKASRIMSDIFNKKLGFKVIAPAGISEDVLFSTTSALLEFYFLKRDDKINSIAKRHARWLIQ